MDSMMLLSLMTDYFNQLTASACPLPRSGFRTMPEAACMALSRDCPGWWAGWDFNPSLPCTKKKRHEV